MKPILVDTNTHVIAPPELRSKYPLNIYPGTESEFTEDQTNSPEGFLQRMDEAGLDQAYLMASRFHGFDNSYCADAVANSPAGRYIGVANVDIQADDAPQKVSYWIEERGMHGIRFWGGGPVAGHRFPGDERGLAIWVDDPALLPVWERVRDLGVPSNAQATMPEVLPNTRRLLERFGEIPFTINNLAHVPAKQGADSPAARDLLSLAQFPRVYVNFSVNFIKQGMTDAAARELLVALVEHFGARRLIWSAFGQKLGPTVTTMTEGVAFLSPADQAGILGEGARDLYPALAYAPAELMAPVKTKLEASLQLHLPTYRRISLPALVGLGQIAHAGGMQQLWVTDNLQSRNAFVVLAALANAVPVSLGTAVLVQYFRNPIDVADAAAAISELMDGRELSLGISRGNPSTPQLMRSPKPVGMLRETAQALRHLLDGEPVHFRDYPTLAAYFNIVPERAYQLNFSPGSPIRLYCGGNAPLSLAVGGADMDGIVFGWTFLAAAGSGRLRQLLKIADDAADQAGRRRPARKVAEIKIYVAQDDATARAHCRRAVASRLLGLLQRGYTPDEYAGLGIPTADVERLFQAVQAGAAGADLADLVTDTMLDALFVAGDPARCRDRLAHVSAVAREYGFQQLMFSELGPDTDAALGLLCDQVLPGAGL